MNENDAREPFADGGNTGRTALEISLLIAGNKFEKRIKAIQKGMPPGSHLFIMHFGLSALYRQMASAEQAVYRELVLQTGQPDAVEPVARAVGIGHKQPSRDRIEYALEK